MLMWILPTLISQHLVSSGMQEHYAPMFWSVFLSQISAGIEEVKKHTYWQCLAE